MPPPVPPSKGWLPPAGDSDPCERGLEHHHAPVNNLWSSNNSSASSYNNGLLQPFLNYNFNSGAYLTTSPIVTVNWQAKGSQQWTVPMKWKSYLESSRPAKYAARFSMSASERLLAVAAISAA